jgi:hypothetical protein
MTHTKTKIILCVMALNLAWQAGAATEQIDLPPAETRVVAKEAYLYGYPLVDNYRVIYTYAVNKSSPEYKGPFNEIVHNTRLSSPDDKTVQTPNADTLYSVLAYDLRAEPLVITLPPVEKERYYSAQFVDLYTFNFDYLGTRTTGNGGGVYLLAGSSWKGEPPKNVARVIRSETDIGLVLFRTQLFYPEDIAKVKAIQAGYKVQPLSAYIGKAAPRLALPIEYLEPLSRADQRTESQFFNELSFALQFCPVHPSEKDLRMRFDKIGVKAGNRINIPVLDFPTKLALTDGMADGQRDILSQIATGGSYTNAYGTREFLKNNYVLRAAGAQAGIYGNSKEEAIYIPYDKDFDNLPLDGKKKYILKFAPGQLPPANAFWSLTMYELPSRLLVTNALKRYVINSAMVPNLKQDADGGTTLYIQHNSPGVDKESNWLPAPATKPWMVLRLYLPKPEAIDGTWQVPTLQAVK